MTEFAAAITYPDSAKTYEAYTTLRNNGPSLGIVSIAIVERDEQGRLSMPDAEDGAGADGLIGGSLIGMLVGILGGPVGMLLGWGVGAAGGAIVDAVRDDDADDALSSFARSIPLGGNVLIAQTDEVDRSVLDAAVAQSGGAILRQPLDEVVAALEAEREAEKAAADAARKEMRAQKKKERDEDLGRRVDALKVAFGAKPKES